MIKMKKIKDFLQSRLNLQFSLDHPIISPWQAFEAFTDILKDV